MRRTRITRSFKQQPTKARVIDEAASEQFSPPTQQADIAAVKLMQRDFDHNLSPDNILALQHTIGNKAVMRLISGQSTLPRPTSASLKARTLQRKTAEATPETAKTENNDTEVTPESEVGEQIFAGGRVAETPTAVQRIVVTDATAYDTKIKAAARTAAPFKSKLDTEYKPALTENKQWMQVNKGFLINQLTELEVKLVKLKEAGKDGTKEYQKLDEKIKRKRLRIGESDGFLARILTATDTTLANALAKATALAAAVLDTASALNVFNLSDKKLAAKNIAKAAAQTAENKLITAGTDVNKVATDLKEAGTTLKEELKPIQKFRSTWSNRTSNAYQQTHTAPAGAADLQKLEENKEAIALIDEYKSLAEKKKEEATKQKNELIVLEKNVDGFLLSLKLEKSEAETNQKILETTNKHTNATGETTEYKAAKKLVLDKQAEIDAVTTHKTGIITQKDRIIAALPNDKALGKPVVDLTAISTTNTPLAAVVGNHPAIQLAKVAAEGQYTLFKGVANGFISEATKALKGLDAHNREKKVLTKGANITQNATHTQVSNIGATTIATLPEKLGQIKNFATKIHSDYKKAWGDLKAAKITIVDYISSLESEKKELEVEKLKLEVTKPGDPAIATKGDAITAKTRVIGDAKADVLDAEINTATEALKDTNDPIGKPLKVIGTKFTAASTDNAADKETRNATRTIEADVEYQKMRHELGRVQGLLKDLPERTGFAKSGTPEAAKAFKTISASAKTYNTARGKRKGKGQQTSPEKYLSYVDQLEVLSDVANENQLRAKKAEEKAKAQVDWWTADEAFLTEKKQKFTDLKAGVTGSTAKDNEKKASYQTKIDAYGVKLVATTAKKVEATTNFTNFSLPKELFVNAKKQYDETFYPLKLIETSMNTEAAKPAPDWTRYDKKVATNPLSPQEAVEINKGKVADTNTLLGTVELKNNELRTAAKATKRGESVAKYIAKRFAAVLVSAGTFGIYTPKVDRAKGGYSSTWEHKFFGQQAWEGAIDAWRAAMAEFKSIHAERVKMGDKGGGKADAVLGGLATVFKVVSDVIIPPIRTLLGLLAGIFAALSLVPVPGMQVVTVPLAAFFGSFAFKLQLIKGGLDALILIINMLRRLFTAHSSLTKDKLDKDSFGRGVSVAATGVTIGVHAGYSMHTNPGGTSAGRDDWVAGDFGGKKFTDLNNISGNLDNLGDRANNFYNGELGSNRFTGDEVRWDGGVKTAFAQESAKIAGDYGASSIDALTDSASEDTTKAKNEREAIALKRDPNAPTLIERVDESDPTAEEQKHLGGQLVGLFSKYMPDMKDAQSSFKAKTSEIGEVKQKLQSSKGDSSEVAPEEMDENSKSTDAAAEVTEEGADVLSDISTAAEEGMEEAIKI